MALSRRRLVSLALGALVALGALQMSIGRIVAQRPASDPLAVRILDVAGARAPNGTDKGATFHWLEGQAARVTTRFSDAVAVTERLADGDSKTTVTDLAGNEVATFEVDRIEATNSVMEFRSPDQNPVVAAGRADMRPTLEWGNRQAYSLWKDRQVKLVSTLEWRDSLMRPRGAPARNLDREIAEVRTEWTNGVAATASRETGPRLHVLTGKPLRGNSFVSRVRKDNVEVGFSRWFAEEQVLVWSFPGLTTGSLNAASLSRIGGWPFTPDMAWANVQGFAFHYFHTLIATQGFVARKEGGLRDRIASFFMPTVFANEPGCDGLHWLDGTVFRPCCDVHDRCYEKYGCNASSWWQFWYSWRCTGCNAFAVFCFGSGTWPPYTQSPF